MAEEKKITAEDMMDEITKLAEGLAGITAAVTCKQSWTAQENRPKKKRKIRPSLPKKRGRVYLNERS